MQLVAINRPQLEAAHTQMLEWVEQKLSALDTEQREEVAAQEVTIRAGWKAVATNRRIRMIERRKVFYEKIRAAIKDGYVIVPNFQLNVFAIRTDRSTPEGNLVRVGKYEGTPAFEQPPRLLPAGEGRYVNPRPSTSGYPQEEKDAKGVVTTVRYVQPEEFQEVDFPFQLAKPALMEEVDKAMRKEIFDEIGVAADSWRGGSGKPDPIIVGRLRNPRPGGPAISFFIGWFFDPSRL